MMIFSIIPREVFDRVQQEMARRASLNRKKHKYVKTELCKYPGKYALTELLVCGKCDTAYRRAVWSKNGKKKVVWRCISRMEYGKKYCPDSPTFEETAVQRAIVDAIQEVVNDDGCQAALKNLQLHIRMFYGAADENSIANDELRLEQLKSMVMEMAGKDNIAGEDFITYQKSLLKSKKVIAEKKKRQVEAGADQPRMREVLGALNALKNHPIDFDDTAARQLIDCIKVVSKT